MAKEYGATNLIGGAAGSLDYLDGDLLSDGDAATVFTDSGVYHYHLDATSGAAENSPYVIAPDTNPGTKRWLLVTPQAPFSHVRAKTGAGQSIPSGTHTTVIFGTEEYDDLSEYNNTTGEFTATYAGKYIISGACLSDTVSWLSDRIFTLLIYVDDTLIVRGSRQEAQTSFSGFISSVVSTTLSLAASEVVTLRILQNQGTAVNLITQDSYNYITIDRIA